MGGPVLQVPSTTHTVSASVSLAATSRSFMTTLRFEQKPEVAISQAGSSTTLGTGGGLGANVVLRAVGLMSSTVSACALVWCV